MSAGIDINASSSVCRRCGMSYGRLKGYFPVCYSALNKGVGYMPYCKSCVDSMYNDYLAKCGNAKDAVRQMCRKLDLYWNEKIFDIVEKTSVTHTMMTSYVVKINTSKYAGKAYDDTLEEEGALWVWPLHYNDIETISKKVEVDADETDVEIDQDIVAFWGPGYTPSMYLELEQRLQYYKSHMPDINMDIGTEALLRQICMAEIDINKARAEGKTVDKMVNSLNTLLGSAMLKPAQKKEDADDQLTKTPFGVWIKLWEDKRPTPEISDDLKDVDGITHYVLVWFYGHLCHMLGIKNGYSKLYEDEINRLKVERPEYEEEDEESMLYDIFGDAEDDEER